MSQRKNDSDEAIQGELVVVGADSLAALTRAEIDMQISTAKRYPRDVKAALNEMMTFATEDPQIAASMFYVLPPRGEENKKIQGPSVRLAEVAGCCWGNIRYGARIIDVGERTVTAQGVCLDLERNIQASPEVVRSIWGRGGRYKDHMIATTCQAACSIAIREAIFKVIPRAYVLKVYEKARRVSLGEAKTMGERREMAMDWWIKSGATKEQILAACNRTRVDELTDEDIIELHGLSTSVKDGDITLEVALGLQGNAAGSKVRTSPLNEKLGKKPPAAADDDSDPLGGELASETTDPQDPEPPLNALGYEDYREMVAASATIDELREVYDGSQTNDGLSDDEKQSVKALCSKRREAIEMALAEKKAETEKKASGKQRQKGLVE